MANYIIDSLNLSNDKHVFTLPYGISSTAAGTAAKTVTVENFVESLDELEAGTTINVKFTNANSASSPTLNVNGTGAIAISSPYTVKGGAYKWVAGSTLLLTYDGTNWVRQFVEDTNTDTNTAHAHGDGAGLTLTGSGGTSGTTTYAVGQGVGIKVNANDVAANLKSTTALTSAATAATETAGRVYPVATDKDGYLAVNVPWTDTTYTASKGIKISNKDIQHTNSVTAGTAKGSDTKTLTYGDTFTIPTVKYDAQGHITEKGATTMTMPAMPTPADLGLENAMHFRGELSSIPTDNTGYKNGDVVLVGSKEYVLGDDGWILLGDEGSYALRSVKISAGNGLTVTAGGTLAGDTTIAHADTSSQASVTASGRKYITGVTLDGFGHVTGLTTGTETVTDTNQKIKVGSTTFGNNDTVELVAGTNVTLTPNATNKTITITSTDTNTHNSHTINSGKKADNSTDIVGASSSGALVMGDSGVTSGEYGPTANATLTHSGTFVIPDIKVNAKGIVTSVTNRTMTLPADNNTTYTPQKLGFGYATCGTEEATKAKVATLSSYVLTTHGIVAVKFTYAVPAGSSTTPITLNINSKGAKNVYYNGTHIAAGVIKAGDVATFIYTGSVYELISVNRWHNDITTLNTRSTNHTHTVSHTPAGSNASVDITPAGTVSKPTFTGTAASHKHTFTGTEASHGHTVTVTEAELSTSYTPAGTVTVTLNTGSKTSGAASTSSGHTVSVAAAAHTHSYTPAGTNSKPTFTGTEGTTTSTDGTTSLYQITGVGTVPSLTYTAGTAYGTKSVDKKCLIIGNVDVDNITAWSAGSVPTRASVTVASSTHSHKYTPSGEVSAPTFTGTAATIAASTTKAATVPTTSHTHSTSGFATSVKSATFAGTAATIDHTHTHTATATNAAITPAGTISETSITPAGSVSQPTFTGTKSTHTHTFTGTPATLTTSKPAN